MPEFTWEELSSLSLALKEERTIIFGIQQRLSLADEKIERVVQRLDSLIEKNN